MLQRTEKMTWIAEILKEVRLKNMKCFRTFVYRAISSQFLQGRLSVTTISVGYKIGKWYKFIKITYFMEELF